MIAALLLATSLAASPSPNPTAQATAAPPIAAPAAMVAAAPADGTYTYDLTIAGQTTTSTITVKRQADGIHFTENSDIASHVVSAALVLNSASLAPAAYAATYDVGTPHSQDLAISFGGSVASVTTFGQQTTLVAQPGAPHFVLLDGAMPTGFFVLPAVAAAARDASLTAINAGALTAVAVSLNRDLSIPRPASVPSGDVAVSVVTPTAFSVWYDPQTFVMHELDVPLQNVVEKFVKYVAANRAPSAVAIAGRGEHRINARYSAAVLTARH